MTGKHVLKVSDYAAGAIIYVAFFLVLAVMYTVSWLEVLLCSPSIAVCKNRGHRPGRRHQNGLSPWRKCSRCGMTDHVSDEG